MSDAILSQGTLVEVLIGGVYTEVKEIRALPGLGSGEAAEIDATHLRSLAMEYKQGLPDEGTARLEGNWLPTDPGQVKLRDARRLQQEVEMRITFSDASTAVFTAIVKTFERTVGTNDLVRLTSALRITGLVTEA